MWKHMIKWSLNKIHRIIKPSQYKWVQSVIFREYLSWWIYPGSDSKSPDESGRKYNRFTQSHFNNAMWLHHVQCDPLVNSPMHNPWYYSTHQTHQQSNKIRYANISLEFICYTKVHYCINYRCRSISCSRDSPGWFGWKYIKLDTLGHCMAGS